MDFDVALYHVQFFLNFDGVKFEPRHEKNRFLPVQKQRRRSAVQ